MDGMGSPGMPPAKKGMPAGSEAGSSRAASDEHERLERLRRCASYISMGSADGSDGDFSEDWTFESGPAAKPRLLESKAGGIWALARRADGTVFVGTQAGEVRAWVTGSEGTPGALLGQHADGVYAVALSVDGRTLFSASAETVRAWDVSIDAGELGEGVSFTELSGHSECVYALAVSQDGRTLFSAGEDCTIRVWRLEAQPSGGLSATCVDVLDEHIAPVTALAVGPQGMLFSAGEDRTVRIWRLTADGLGYTCSAILEGHTAAVTSLHASSDAHTLFSGSWDQSVRVWEYSMEDAPVDPLNPSAAPQQRLKHSLAAVLTNPANDGAVLCLAVSADGSKLFTGGSDKAVHVWSLPEALAAAKAAAAASSSSSQSAAAADGSAPEPAVSSPAPSEGQGGAPQGAGPLPRISECSCADSDEEARDAGAAAAADAERSCGPAVRRLEGHRRAVTSLVVLPDGCSLLSGSVDRTMREWKVALPKQWSPAVHSQYPEGFRQGVQALLMAVSAASPTPAGSLSNMDWATKEGLITRMAAALARSTYDSSS